MSQKRDHEEDEMENRKAPRLFSEELRLTQYLKDLEYFKYNIPPSWEELKEKQDNSVPWDMSDVNDIIKKLDSRPTPPSFEQLRKRHERLQADLLQKEEKWKRNMGNVYMYIVI